MVNFKEVNAASMPFDNGSSANLFPEKKPVFAGCSSPVAPLEPETVGAAAVPPFCFASELPASAGDCTRTFLVLFVSAGSGSTGSPVLWRLRAFPFSCVRKHQGRGGTGGGGDSNETYRI